MRVWRAGRDVEMCMCMEAIMEAATSDSSIMFLGKNLFSEIVYCAGTGISPAYGTLHGIAWNDKQGVLVARADK